MSKRLDGKVAIVTGGSSGIGRATAIAFAKEGANVAIAAGRLTGFSNIAAVLLAKSLTQVQGLAIYNTNQLIQSLDILVVQANINTIFAQFIGIIISAWLISRINHH